MSEKSPTSPDARKWIVRSLWTAVALPTSAVFGQFFIQVATDKGLYDNAGNRWDEAVTGTVALFSDIFAVLTSPLAINFGVFAFGALVGMYADWRFFKRNLPTTTEQKQIRTHAAERAQHNDPEKLVFPYKKTVVRIKQIKGSASAKAGSQELENLTYSMDVESATQVPLMGCRIRVVDIQPSGFIGPAFLRRGRLAGDNTKTDFDLRQPTPQRLHLLGRNLADVIDNPPFLVYLNTGDFPLVDGTLYTITLHLESPHEISTEVVLSVQSTARDKIVVTKISEEGVERISS